MLVAPGAIFSTTVLYREHLCLSRCNCGAIPLLRLGVEGDGKLKQRCQRGSEFKCAPDVAAFVGKLVAEVA
jgi:hypothetical protein